MLGLSLLLLLHGGCYSPGEPEKYFNDALAVNAQLTEYTSAVNALAGQTVSTKSIEHIYPKSINVICDPNTKEEENTPSNSSLGRFLELRTCWSTAQEPIDCPAAFSNAFGVPCPEYTYFLD